ncbi:hypothetical protein L6R52_02390 [Myxococcota bacterium]|nr:hypothetical protein [Myxococcota bacterium]
MDLAAVILALVTLAPPAAEPACVQSAKALVKKAEALPMVRRARVLELAIRKDPSVLCGVVDQSFFASAPVAPEGCDATKPHTCRFPKGLEVAERLAEDADPILYLRVQLIATRLTDAARMSAAHRRLLETLLLASALAREEGHGH